MRFLSPHSEVQSLLGNTRGTTISPGLHRYPLQKVGNKKFCLLQSCALKAAASDLANTHSNIPIPTQRFAKISKLDNRIHGGWHGGVQSKAALDDLGYLFQP